MRPPKPDEELEGLVSSYLEVACTAVGARAGYAVLDELPSGGPAIARVCCDGDEGLSPQLALSLERDRARWVPDASRTLQLPAGAAGPGLPPGLADLASSGLLREPIEVDGKVAGALLLLSARGAAFSVKDVALVQSVCRLAAGAVASAERCSREIAHRRIAQTLSAFSMAITESFDVRVVLGVLLDYLQQIVPYDRATAMLLEGEDRFALRAVHEHGGMQPWAPEPPPILDARAIPVLRRLVDQKRGVRVQDIQKERTWAGGLTAPGSRSWMAIPLLVKDRVIGLYGMEMTAPGQYDDVHLEQAGSLAGHAASAIQSAWLFEKVGEGRSRLQSLSRLLVKVQEDERRAVSRELHDESGQSLASLKLGLHLLEHKVRDPETLKAGLVELQHQVDGVILGLHRLAANLRPASLDHVGLAGALRQMVESIDRRDGPLVDFEGASLGDARLSEFTETALYRIGQEAVSNAVQHACARHVSVLLKRRGSRIVLLVEDDGVGFDPVLALHGGRLGLTGMRERAEMIGGSLLVESGKGKGTVVVAEVPDADSDHSG